MVGGQNGTAQDKSGHLPQAAENDTIFAPQADRQPEENISEATPEAGQGFQGTFFLPFFASDFNIESKIERNIPIRKEWLKAGFQ